MGVFVTARFKDFGEHAVLIPEATVGIEYLN